jgi:hypothetical protein
VVGKIEFFDTLYWFDHHHKAMDTSFYVQLVEWDNAFRKLLDAWLAKVGVEPHAAPVATAPVATAHHDNRDCVQREKNESNLTARENFAAPVASASVGWLYKACSNPDCERSEMGSRDCELKCGICGAPTGNKQSGF